MADDLPEMIRTHIRSVWALELLLLLRRSSDRVWRVQELSDELRATRAIVDTCVAYFERIGLVARDDDGRLRYAPASSMMAEFCDSLDAEYRRRPVAVINVIAAPEDRIQQLADAFRFSPRDSK